MNMCETDFLRVLVRTIQLHDDLRFYITPYHKFSYDLGIVNGALVLTIHYPSMGKSVVISYSSKQCDDAYDLLDEAEAYLKEKQG